MKKITCIFVVLAVLVGSLMMMGCGANDILADTYDTWYVYKRAVNVPSGEDDNSEANGMLKNAKVYVKFNKTNGLDVRVCSTVQSTVTFGGIPYEIQTDQTAGADMHYAIDTKVNSVTWGIMLATGNFIKEEPSNVTITLDNLVKGEFNFKRFLAQLLLGTLD